MAEIKINTTSAIQNPSLQVGDHAFYQEIDSSQPLNSANDPIYIGPITEIDSGFIKVEAVAGTNPNDIIGFLMFSKDKRVNNSDLMVIMLKLLLKIMILTTLQSCLL